MRQITQNGKRHLILFGVFLGLFLLFIVFQNFSKFESHNVFPAQVQFSSLQDKILSDSKFSKSKEFYTFITAPANASKLVVCYNVKGAIQQKCDQPTDGVEINLSNLEPIKTESKSITIAGCPTKTNIKFHTYRLPNKPEEMGFNREPSTAVTQFDVSTYIAGEYQCDKGFVEDGLLRFSHSSHFAVQ